MAKIVLAGRSDCPYFAKCERIGDRLAKNLVKFKLHKIVIQPDQWEEWLKETCRERGWTFTKSPIIWRELIDRGGKGVLIGDSNDFQEYAKAYYDVDTSMKSEQMLLVAGENKITKDVFDEEEAVYKASSHPVHICITNGGSPICYHLLNCLSSGKIFNANTEITIHLLVTSPRDIEKATGYAMEAEDIAHGCLSGVDICTSPVEAFKNCSVIILLDNIHKPGTEPLKTWLEKNVELFTRYSIIINNTALKSCKIVLCGDGPLNFNAVIVAKNAQNINRDNIVAFSSTVENHAKSVVGELLTVNSADVANLIVWGNINHTRKLDLSHCIIYKYKGAIRGPSWHSKKCTDLIPNSFINNHFPKIVAAKSHKVSRALGSSTSMSTAAAIYATLQLWLNGSSTDQIYSLGVCSGGWYDVPAGVYFSFPVRFDRKGSWSVVTDLSVTKDIKVGIASSLMEIRTYLRLFNMYPQPLPGSTKHSGTMPSAAILWAKALKKITPHGSLRMPST